jgi:phosphohistidine phosphatase
MKVLLLVRHGKSSWDNDNLTDADRPLAPRGIKEVPVVSKMIKDLNYQPDYIVSSPTLRTRQTTELLIKGLGIKNPMIVWDTNLYNQQAKFIFKWLKRLDNDVKVPMLVAHDTFLAELVYMLTNKNIEKFYTSACAVIHLNIDQWSEMKESNNELLHFLHPIK